MQDTDGDTLFDGVEGEMTADTVNGSVTTYTSPVNPDTDGDGLPDSNEISVDGDAVSMSSDPSQMDTDSDRLTDYEEVVKIGSKPMNEDTDGDGSLDIHDPNITIENNAPTMMEFSSGNYRKRLEFTVSDRSSFEVTVRAYYGSTNGWRTDTNQITHLGNGRYQVAFDEVGSQYPNRYWINATDEHGNKLSVVIDTNGGGAEIKKAGSYVVAVGSKRGSASPWIIGGAILIGTALIIGGTYAVEYQKSNPDIVPKLSSIGTAETYRPSHQELPSRIALPTGVYTVQRGVEHGHGWAYISATTSITQSQIEYVINNPRRVIRDDEIIRIIGKASNGDTIILTIIGGMVMAAEEPGLDSTTDGTKNCRDVHHTESQLEHAAREDKLIDVIDVLEAIENPAAVGKSGDYLYYIRKVSGKEGWIIIRVLRTPPKQVLKYFGTQIRYWLSTSLINEDTMKLWNSLEDAKEGAEENAKGNRDKVKDWNDDPNGC